MLKSAKSATKMEHQSSEDEEDVLEMERNFALLSKRSTTRTSAEDEEEMRDEDAYVEEDGAEPEEDEDESGSDEDEVESNPEEGVSNAQPNTEGNLKKELANMTFQEIINLQNKVGTKAYNKIAYGATKPQNKNEPMKRLNKHRPQEISAKKHVPFLRKVVPVKKRISRDPRFDDLSGEFKPEIFNQTYKFLNAIREKETKIVKKKLRKTKSDSKKEEMKALLKRMQNQQKAQQRQEQEREKDLQFKRKQRELVGQGHKPFYLKKSDKKKLELAEKYSELKKSGKLENFLSKKRKRNATKDRKKLPYQHNKR
ncbi:ribosomal RNA processing protein 36 homolog [Puntigrus tetrazona]|uniref:ribosomal RNA processing protein 36 homolog n=1 Tax=Puntigrus tetrazona TaxID=1606681 RepID=UPI001C897AFD|nr:ribosomal RNA processing protein 36 homolog [Puntigrus tetrazona]XP_043078385.1 ribosomal RNA processing protein 36 homolog [Puntigrus tetrazona]